MTSFKEQAKAYEPKQTLNVTDLERFDISTELEERTGNGSDGKDYIYQVAIIDKVEYRVPNTVLEETKKLLAVKDDIKFIKAVKQGSGLNTKYSVVLLE
jgi:hypothetical protein